MERSILIHFNQATGEVQIEAEGFSGLTCLEATQPFEEALGVVNEGDRAYKPEAERQQVHTTFTHQTRLRQ